MPRALIFANGEFSNPGRTRSIVRPDDVVIAADGGARHALAIGIIPSIIIGDLDSLSEVEVRTFTEMDVEILRYSPVKDETDLELALAYALRTGFSQIVIVGALGGRLDQTLGNLALLTNPGISKLDIRLDDGLTEAFFIDNVGVILGEPGDTISFIPWGGPVEGVVTAGLLYPLHGETLIPYRTRSISNQLLGHTASLRLKSGLLLCIHIRKVD